MVAVDHHTGLQAVYQVFRVQHGFLSNSSFMKLEDDAFTTGACVLTEQTSRPTQLYPARG
jgi:hypothetical protein